MSQILQAEEEWCHLDKAQKSGSFSSMSAYLISATSAAVLTMTIGTVRCGLIVKVP